MHVLKTILGWLLGLVILSLVANISISNSHDTAIYFWPFGLIAIIPLWMIVLGSFSAGLIIGGIILWPKLLMSRLRNHQSNRRIQRLETDLADLAEDFNNLPQHEQTPSLTASSAQPTAAKDKSHD